MGSWEYDASKANNHESKVTQTLIITDLCAENEKTPSLSLMLGMNRKRHQSFSVHEIERKAPSHESRQIVQSYLHTWPNFCLADPVFFHLFFRSRVLFILFCLEQCGSRNERTV